MKEYDAKTCKNDARYDKDFAFGWYCDQTQYVASLNGDHQNVTIYAPEYITKAFYPKTAGFTAVKDENKLLLQEWAWPR